MGQLRQVLDSDGELFYDFGQLPRQRATHCWLSTTVKKTAQLRFIPGGCVLHVCHEDALCCDEKGRNLVHLFAALYFCLVLNCSEEVNVL